MKRPNSVSPEGLPSLAEREESVCLSIFPTLNDLLTNPNWDDATPKGKICVMLFVDEVSVRVLLKLESVKLKTSTVGHTVDDALALLEKSLKSGQVVWEQDAGHQNGSQKKRK